ncbi:helix-turn-helix domain-containing protein [Paracoccus sp. SCSIO 75233]|uniref:winged helix-turn-helix transcriptional regulator n=1 Tax=Paracoccus sp. SCSIO 75233 TaxID=3017782 RepID=UPI0022EFD87A|nr:helix-turn-helix domain-containing protein [Paracoccus sp. SCSIO 75233]WBU53228.1 helix-turn-helix domain-containing protein [Paracoccus sp. SCSIO 75233]
MTNDNRSARLRYDDGCLAAHSLNLIGDRWALLVVRELMFTPKRFQMIRAGLPGITASVLTGRLAQLRDVGVVDHDTRLGIYSLTEMGRGLLPVLEALCRWSLMAPGHDPRRFISPSALMISMRVNLIPDAAQGTDAHAGFDFGTEAFEMRLTGGTLETRPVNTPDAPFVLKGTGNTVGFTVYGAAPVELMMKEGFISAEGDLTAAQSFVDLFRLDRTA